MSVPRATLSLHRIESLVPSRPPRARLEELLFASKAQVEGGTGDELLIEGTADRLDLLTESGLGLYLQGATGASVGLPPLVHTGASPISIEVDASVTPLRPEIAAVVVQPPPGQDLESELLEEAIRFQELLHATIGLDRRLASLGIYPVERIQGPVRYARDRLDAIRFVPLDGDLEVEGGDFYARHPMAARYGELGRSEETCLVLRDAAGSILSLPPVLNSRGAGEARPGDRALLLESTGTRASRVEDAVGLLSLVFVAHGWSVADVPVSGSRGRSDGSALLRPRSVHLNAATIARVAGTEIPSQEVVQLLEAARLGVHPLPHGWRVELPPWRPDILAPVDLVEELVLARGLRPEDGIVPPSATRGGRSPAARFREHVRDLLLGLGLVPLYTPVLVSERMAGLAQRESAVALSNPVSDQFSRMRDSLAVPLLQVLERNVRHGYPQRFSEVGPVVVATVGSETGAETRDHAGVLLAHDGAGFAEAAALADYLLRTFGTTGVREPAELPATIPGRAAVLRLAGEGVAEIGEIAPSVLRELRVPVPAAWVEWDLTALRPLVDRSR
jgi:phenylalanyl-tRNA synthetase beta chain